MEKLTRFKRRGLIRKIKKSITEIEHRKAKYITVMEHTIACYRDIIKELSRDDPNENFIKTNFERIDKITKKLQR